MTNGSRQLPPDCHCSAASEVPLPKKKIERAKIYSVVIAVTLRDHLRASFCLRVNFVATRVVWATMIESTNSWTRIVGLSGFATNFWRTLYAPT